MSSIQRISRTASATLAVFIFTLLFSLAIVPWAKSAEVSGNEVLRATLPNGLRVIIVRNTLAPVVATAVNYLVGSDEAPEGFPGTAHAQEHMMFRGSPGLSSDQLANIGNAMGGNFNANTRESLTQYLYTVPAEDLDVALNIEASRMRDVSDTEVDWDKERGAIEQEVAQDLSNPSYVLYEKLRAELFAGTPYAHDALGTRPSFDKTPASMLKAFHNQWYAPNNAILVIVGDIQPQETLANVRKLFGSIPKKHLPGRPKIILGPLTAGAFSLHTDRPEATQVVAMRTPGLDSPDFPAMEVLADVLQSQRSALYDLVVQGRATDVQFSLDPLPHAGLGYATVSFPSGSDAQSIDRAIRKTFSELVHKGVQPDLVAAAKLQERRQAEFEKNSISDLASVWSEAVALYGLSSPDADLERINKVTVADVNRVARKYLDVAHAVSATMVPQRSGRPTASSVGFGGQETIALGEGKATTLPQWAEAALGRLQIPASTLHPVVSKLANGLTLIVQPETVSNTVTVYGHIRHRAETEEPAGKDGVSLLLSRLLAFGTAHLDRVAFQKALDQLGASEEAGTDFSIKVLAQDYARGVELLADNELHPALPQSAFDAIKPPLAQAIASRNHSAGYLAQQALRRGLFPPGDPSLRDATEETIENLSRSDVLSYFHLAYRPDLTTIVVVGNISPERAKASIERYFGDWQSEGPPPSTDLPSAPLNAAEIVSVPDTSRVQNIVVLAHNLDMVRNSPDFYALSLGNAVLGGGFYSTRLSIDLRKETGLVYSVSSALQAGRTRSVYLIQYASDPGNVVKAAQAIAHEISNMQDEPVSADELTRAKALLLRQMPLQESDIDAIAQGFSQRVDLNLPLDEPTRAARNYLSLSAADVQAAFRKWMRPDSLVRMSQGPAL